MPDPLRLSRGAANMGATGLGRTGVEPGQGALWELGEIVAYNSATHTSLVRTHSGRPLKDVPQMRASAGSFDHLPTGTTVVVFWGLGIPVIQGVLDLVGVAQSAIPSPSLTGVEGVGDVDPTQSTQGTNNYKPPGAPTDMMQGDWAQVGTLGNHVAVLEGGVSLLGSPSAQVQSLGATGTLRTVARRIQQITDFGQLTVENDQGRTSLVLRAGSSQTTETGLDERHWTIRFDLGATGDMLDFQIVEPEGRLLFRLHAGADGRVQIYGDGGVDLSSGPNGAARMRHDVVGDHATMITGDAAHEVRGDASRVVDGAAKTSVAGAETRSTGGDLTSFVGGAHDVGVSGDQTHAIGGKRLSQVSGNDETQSDGDITSTARQVNTVEGARVKLGANATQRVIKGDSFQASVVSQLGAAGSAMTAAGAAATAAVSPDVVIGTPTAGTITAVAALAAAMTALGGLLSAAASAYPTTLSTKVSTE